MTRKGKIIFEVPDIEIRRFVPNRCSELFNYIVFDLDHSLGVARLNFFLGKKMGFSERELLALYYGGLFHDAGKGALPRYLLAKNGKLSETERKLVKTHPSISFSLILERIGAVPDEFLQIVADCCLYHHERLDGSGYPIGLNGNEIPFHARITAVADVFSALTANRPYRKRLEPHEAIEVIRKETEAGLFDAKVVEVLASFVNSV